MRRPSDSLDVVDTMYSQAAKCGAAFHILDDTALEGRLVSIQGNPTVNFGSCSYLGLETHPQIKKGIIDATMRYGSQFSSSRAYLSAAPYREVEELLAEVFGAPVLVTPTTSLGHITALPVLIDSDDVVLLDQQVHHSVQTAANLVRVQGTRIEMIRHSRLDLLEAQIVELRKRYRKIWYLADGVYSMYGDLVPSEGLLDLLNRYEELWLYVDDAHGVSWSGLHGRGVALTRLGHHPRIIFTASLNKSFAAAGGALIFPNAELMRRVRYCGGPMTFSGPVQPPMLGAIAASAKIHLSEELEARQAALLERVQYCNRLMKEYELPVVSPSEAPIRFVGLGLPRLVFNMVNRLMRDGYYVNAACFPAVAMRRAGLRFTLTNHQEPEDILGLVRAIARHLPSAMREEGATRDGIMQDFRKTGPLSLPSLRVQKTTTIEKVDREEWDHLLGSRGAFSWDNLRFLEKAFGDRPEPENHWDFHYYIVRDALGTPVLATFFTEALWKDDMLSPEAASRLVEQHRAEDPYYLTSKALAMGTLLTEGNALYLNRSLDWKGALDLLLRELELQRESSQCVRVVLRDLPEDDPEIDAFLLEQGFTKHSLPDSLILEGNWKTEEEYLLSLSKKARQHQLRAILPFRDLYRFDVIPKDKELAQLEWERLYELYQNVKSRSYELNTYELPRNLFKRMHADPSWELMRVFLQPEHGGDEQPVAMLASFVGQGRFVPTIIGLDYRYVISQGLYRSILYEVVSRAIHYRVQEIDYGFGATMEKQKMGAKIQKRCLYMQSADNFNLEILSHLMADAAQSRR